MTKIESRDDFSNVELAPVVFDMVSSVFSELSSGVRSGQYRVSSV